MSLQRLALPPVLALDAAGADAAEDHDAARSCANEDDKHHLHTPAHATVHKANSTNREEVNGNADVDTDADADVNADPDADAELLEAVDAVDAVGANILVLVLCTRR